MIRPRKTIVPLLFVLTGLFAAWQVAESVMEPDELMVGATTTSVQPGISTLPSFSPRSLQHCFCGGTKASGAAVVRPNISGGNTHFLPTGSSARTHNYGTMAYSYTESDHSVAGSSNAAAVPSCCFLALSSTRRLAEGGGQTAVVEQLSSVGDAPGGPRCAPGPPTLTEDDKQLGYEAPIGNSLWLLIWAAVYALVVYLRKTAKLAGIGKK